MNLRAIYDELETLPQEEHHYEFAMTNWRERAACAMRCFTKFAGEGNAEAIKWLRKAARNGCKSNPRKTAYWYRIGTERGNEFCLEHLRKLESKGRIPRR